MKKRKDSFFGLHFDIHANENTLHIGRYFKTEWIKQLLEEVKPDFVQVDAKGHPGIASYPSAFGPSAPEMETDRLKKWRELTKEAGVALFAHYSGVFDSAAAKERPEWAVVDKNGVVSDKYTSVFGEYKNEKLIPQIKELAGKYGLDGVWVDGECWACQLDFSDNAKKAFKEEYGREVDYAKDKALYVDFCRKGYKKYLNEYISEIKSQYPDFEITSNWYGTSYTPNAGSIPCDFISGDLPWVDPIDNGARFDLKFFIENGKPWDVMSWGFAGFAENNVVSMQLIKTPVQLMQEAAYALSLGGAYQLYYKESPELGFYDRGLIKTIKEVAEFCRQRKDYCRGKTFVKEIAMVFSATKYYNEIDEKMFVDRKEYIEDFRYLNNSLCDNGYFTLFETAEKGGDLGEYKTVVVSDSDFYSDAECERLIRYAEKGGNLVVAGASASALFAAKLAIACEKAERQAFVIEDSGSFFMGESDFAYLDPSSFDETTVGYRRREDFFIANAEGFPVTARKKQGKGIITFIPFAAGQCYNQRTPCVLRDFIKKAVGLTPRADIQNTRLIDVALTKDDDCFYVHLINHGGVHFSSVPRIFDEIPPVRQVEMSIESDKKPQKIILRPKNEDISFDYSDGRIKLKLDETDVYEILQIVYGEQ